MRSGFSDSNPASGFSTDAASATAIGQTRQALEEWVQTRRMISEERSEWSLLKGSLMDTVDLLTRQRERLKEKTSDLKESQSAADEQREKLLSENARLEKASAALVEIVATVEQRILELIPLFPEPLFETVEPLLRRIPDPDEVARISLGARMQNIVGILGQAEKFNGQVTLANRTQSLPDGREVRVKTLYWGLGQAWFVDTAGSFGGVGYPSVEGWVFEEVEGIAPAVTKLLSAFEGDANEIGFTLVPASIR